MVEMGRWRQENPKAKQSGTLPIRKAADSVAWLLLTFLGVLGIHRMYLGKWITGILYLLTCGLLGLGYLYDYWTLNDQVALIKSG
jgi:hypothetical protein